MPRGNLLERASHDSLEGQHYNGVMKSAGGGGLRSKIVMILISILLAICPTLIIWQTIAIAWRPVGPPGYRFSAPVLARNVEAFPFFKHGATYVMSDPALFPLSIRDWEDDHYGKEFSTFVSHFKRDYKRGTKEFQYRFEIFKDNLRFIHKHNEARRASYTLAPNKFADLNKAERREATSCGDLNSWSASRSPGGSMPHVSTNISLPTEMDWSKQGCVTAIKDQGQCGSCWAFASTGAIEGAVCAKTGRLYSLSEQQLLDCGFPEGSEGCNGGFMDNAFQYVLDANGLCTESSYPYLAKEGICEASQCQHVVTIRNYVDVPPRSEISLRTAVAHNGPVAVGIEADRSAFQFYHDGVFDLPCGTSVDHAVLIVGYGTDEVNGEEFWKVKNSWGPTWGDHGFIRISREPHGRLGECGILTAPVYPVV